jgi:tRNA-Thr(GGU) m(6)t(6)A37 methyltransferase TsaA
MHEISLKPIGYVRTMRAEIEDDHWGSVSARIELDPEQFDADALKGLNAFSHLEVIYHMHKVDPSKITSGARHPRNNPEWPEVGVLAQRVKSRPNLLGLSRANIVRVDGLSIEVLGLDAIDGTPVLDVKPYIQEFGPRGEVTQPEWATELMKNYYA